MVRGLQVGPPDNKNNNNIKYRYGRYVSSCGIPPGFFCFDLLTPLFIIDSPIRLLLPRTDFYEIYWDLLALVPNIQATVLGGYYHDCRGCLPQQVQVLQGVPGTGAGNWYSTEYGVRVLTGIPLEDCTVLPPLGPTGKTLT